MRRAKDTDGWTNRAAKIAGGILAAGAGLFLLRQLGSLRRYLHMRSISSRPHARPPDTLTPSDDASPRWGTTHWPIH